MERIFEFDNKNEVKLSVEGFDKAPILMGSEQSNGIIELENLTKFQGCNISVRSVNIKDENNEVTELRTYYTIVEAKEKKYNNDIIDVINRKEDSKILVEVCLGIGEYKRFIILERPSTESLVDITKQLPSEISKMFSVKRKDLDEMHSDSDKTLNSIEIILYDRNGFEINKSVSISEISNYILSVRIIGSEDDTIKDTVSKKANEVFKRIKENGRNNIEVISNFTSSVMKMVSLKRA